MLTTARTRACRLCLFAIMAAVLAFLMGQGCPSLDGQLTVHAGPDLMIESGSVVIQASVSGGSGIYTYSWSPTIGLDKADVLQPVFTAGAVGTITYTLTVQDSTGATASDSVSITVGASSGGPDDGGSGLLKADAGPDKSAAIGASVVLEGGASGGVPPYSFLWSPHTGLSAPTLARPVFTPSVAGSMSYTLTVTDALGASASDSVTINIAPGTSLRALTWGPDYDGGGYQVLATFTQQLDPARAANVANYRIDGVVTPIVAAPAPDGRTVALVFNQRLSSFAKMDIGVGGGLRDAQGGVVTPAANQAIGSSPEDVAPPTVLARTWGNNQPSYTVIIEFSEAMDGTSAEDIHNYLLEGSTTAGGKVAVQPTRAVLDASGKVVTLTFENTSEGFAQADLLKVSEEVRDINRRQNASIDWEPIDLNPADTTGPSSPVLARVWGINPARYSVSVTFDEVLDKASAENPANYELGGCIPNSTSPDVKPAALDPTGRTVTLTFEATTDGLGLTDTLQIHPGVTDINGQPVTTTEPTVIAPNLVDTAGPSLSAQHGRVWAGNQATYQVVLTFNEALDKVSATDVQNYSLAAAGGAKTIFPTSVSLDATGRIVTLDFADSQTGGLNSTDLLTVSDQVTDVNGRANISTMPQGIVANPTDLVPPVALSRTWIADGSSYQAQIEFSEVMDRLTATRLANYRLHGSGGANPQQPSSVVLDATGRIATLTFVSTGSSTGGFNYDDVLEIMPAVTDINGRSTTSITTSGADVARNSLDTVGPGVVRATLFQHPPAEPPPPKNTPILYWIEVVFNEVLDKFSAEQAAYSFDGAGIESMTVLPDGRTVRLGLDYTGTDPIDADLMVLNIPDALLDINQNAAAPGDVTVRLPLMVDAGDDVAMTVGETTTFIPVISGGIAPYAASWTPATPGLVLPDLLEPDFTPPAKGTYNFKLTVTDSEGRTASDTLVVKVTLR